MKPEELLPDSSRKTADIAAAFILKHPMHLEKMLAMAYSDRDKIAMRASRVIFLIQEQAPDMIRPYYNEIINQLRHIQNNAAKRNLLHLFMGNTFLLDEDSLGLLVQRCFIYLESSNSEVAHKVYALEILYEVSIKIPDIKPELITIISHQIETAQSAFKAAGSMILKKLHK